MRGLAVLIALASAGCTDALDHVSSVHDLRILAIGSDPPDSVMPAGVDPRSGGVPPLPVFRIKLLLGDDPQAQRSVQYRVTTCPKADRMRCEGLDGGVGSVMVIGEGSAVPVGGIVEAEVTLGRFEQLAELYPLIQKAIEEDPYKGFGGLPLAISVRVWAGDEEVVGGSRIPLWLPIPWATPGLVPNVAPQEPEVLFDGIVALPGDLPEVRSGGFPLDVFEVPDDLKESYVVPTFDGATKTLRESWSYSWFTTKGYFAPEGTGGYNPALQEDNDTDTQLQILDSEPPGEFKVVCVVRDGRGGESWIIRDAFFAGPR
ncbi:MAG: hypothetical protein HY901_03755 [Deltaproteobacteria bacterium]|nr:hypothetical protein [Deltaproteobacteria bacterium]